MSEDEKKSGYTTLSRLLWLFLYSTFEGMKLEICEFFKGTLDPEYKDFKDEFFELFYSKILLQLLDYLSNSPKDQLTASLIFELLTCCGNTHGYRIRYYVSHNAVLQRLQNFYFSQQKVLRLSMLRWFRSLIFHNDEGFNKYIVKHDLFAPIFKLLQTIKRDNLISAALLDILNVVASQSIRTLISYIMDKYKVHVTEGAYAKNSVMKKIKGKHELFPPAGVKRELSLGKRVYLNYPSKEELKYEEESKSKLEGERKVQLPQKRPAPEAATAAQPLEEALDENVTKKKKEAEDIELK